LIRVLDASVLVQWFVREAGREAAVGLLEEVVARPRLFAVPVLVWYELTHVLPRVAADQDAVGERLARIVHLGIPSFSATAERCERAMKLARRAGLSGYDAHYVVLAEELDGAWVTFDPRAARAIRPKSRVQCLA
jgi:predicted nucleic acid-binding protein